MKSLMMDESVRMEIMASHSFDFFPAPFVCVIKNFLKTKEQYVIFMDHAELPMWKVERDIVKKCFTYSLAESINFDIYVFLCDTGSVYIDVYCLTDKKFI